MFSRYRNYNPTFLAQTLISTKSLSLICGNSSLQDEFEMKRTWREMTFGQRCDLKLKDKFLNTDQQVPDIVSNMFSKFSSDSAVFRKVWQNSSYQRFPHHSQQSGFWTMGGNYTKYEILHLTSILCGLPGLRGTTRARQL